MHSTEGGERPGEKDRTDYHKFTLVTPLLSLPHTLTIYPHIHTLGQRLRAHTMLVACLKQAIVCQIGVYVSKIETHTLVYEKIIQEID
jgi:hypothetical protein